MRNSLKTIFKVFFEAGYQAVILYRISRWFYLKKPVRLLAYFFSRFNLCFTGADIHPASQLGSGLVIPHPVGIVIGGNTRTGEDCIIMHGVTLGAKKHGLTGDRHPMIGSRVMIYCNATILGRINIGDDSIIAANALITQDVPPQSIAMNVNEIIPRQEMNI
jgi:serine O-acetyltransferase